jgi:hypothetical protein
MTRAAPDWGALQSAIAGEVVLPGSPDYESVRKPAITRFHDVGQYHRKPPYVSGRGHFSK